MKKIIGLFLCGWLLSGGTLFAQQVQVYGNYTVEDLVKNVLVGQGIEVSNITVNAPDGSYGMFVDPSGVMGADTGLVITSGQIDKIPGPNDTGNAGQNNSVSGDADLESLTTQTTYDAAIIEFDLKPVSDTIRFQFVFGSDEYNEWVNSNFNDVFGFFLTGPGLPPQGKNLAVLPGSTIPVTINSINNGSNADYYVDNTLNEEPQTSALQYDGFTRVLIAEHYPVLPGATYHIKIAIADATDGNYDSGVFLKGKSFSSPIVCEDMTVDAVLKNVPCFGGSDGGILLNGTSGGVGPYKYALDNDLYASTTNFSNLTAGPHELNIKDANGCVSTQTFTLTQPPRALRFFSTFKKSYVCPDCSDGKIAVSGIGGVGPYQYSLDGMSYKASGVFTDLGPGVYTVYIKDAAGCVVKRTVVLGG